MMECEICGNQLRLVLCQPHIYCSMCVSGAIQDFIKARNKRHKELGIDGE